MNKGFYYKNGCLNQKQQPVKHKTTTKCPRKKDYNPSFNKPAIKNTLPVNSEKREISLKLFKEMGLDIPQTDQDGFINLYHGTTINVAEGDVLKMPFLTSDPDIAEYYANEASE